LAFPLSCADGYHPPPRRRGSSLRETFQPVSSFFLGNLGALTSFTLLFDRWSYPRNRFPHSSFFGPFFFVHSFLFSPFLCSEPSLPVPRFQLVRFIFLVLLFYGELFASSIRTILSFERETFLHFLYKAGLTPPLKTLCSVSQVPFWYAPHSSFVSS